MALRIGFFSDDVGASHAAALVGHGMARAGGNVTVVAPPYRLDPGEEPRANGGVLGLGLPHRSNPYDVQCMLEGLVGRDSDCVVALPLSAIRDKGTCLQFDAVVTVGRDQPAAARALRAARYEAGRSVQAEDGSRPAWFLVGANQSMLRTQANLSSARGPALPFAVRSLPTTLPRLSTIEEAALFDGRPDSEALRNGILLAALVVAVASDPHGRRIDAGTIAELMSARDLPRERMTSDRLVGLANAYERLGEARDDIARPTNRTPGPTLRRGMMDPSRQRRAYGPEAARVSVTDQPYRRLRSR